MHKVMVVEDEGLLADLLDDLLKIEGYHVLRPDDYRNLLPELHAFRPDALIMDVLLDDINGLDILENIRSNHELKDIYVVAISGLDYESQSMQRGANKFLMKPFMPDELVNLLDKELRN